MLESIKINCADGEDWDFSGEDTQYLTHGLHPYPARLVPQVIRGLLERYARRGDVVLDPFYACVKKIYDALDDGGYCCIVIANRTVRRVTIPTHTIIAEMGVRAGLENNVTIIPRNIPSKRLPWENAPENIPGLKGKTMNKENIVVMRKM